MVDFYKAQRLKADEFLLDMVKDLLFAEDCALCASSKRKMQHMVELFSIACKHFGLTISVLKTQGLFQPAPGEPHYDPVITIYVR